MQQDVQIVKSEEVEEMMVVSEGINSSGLQIGNCFGAIFIVRG